MSDKSGGGSDPPDGGQKPRYYQELAGKAFNQFEVGAFPKLRDVVNLVQLRLSPLPLLRPLSLEDPRRSAPRVYTVLCALAPGTQPVPNLACQMPDSHSNR